MAIQLGSIALTRLQAVEVDEPRQLVELRAPNAKGSVFQDMGRGSVRLRLAGIFLGEQALRDIEVLRRAHEQAKPLSFSADIAVGSDITDVIIERFEVVQVPGHRFRYEYRLRVSEWSAPPRSPTADLKKVDQGITAGAKRWAAQSQKIAAGLTNPAALAKAIGLDPTLLDRVDGKELAKAVLGALGGIDGKDVAHLLAAVTDIDPDKAIALLEELRKADSLQEVLQLLADDGLELLDGLPGLDLSGVSDEVRAFVGGLDFIDRAREVTAAARELLAALRTTNPESPSTTSASPQGAPMSTAAEVVARTTTLFERLAALVDSTRKADLPRIAASLGVETTAATLTRALVEVLELIREELHVVAALSQLGALFGLVEPLIMGLRGIIADGGRAVNELGLGGALSVSTTVASGLQRLEGVAALGSSLALAPAQLDGLRRGMDDAIASFERLAEDFEAV